MLLIMVVTEAMEVMVVATEVMEEVRQFPFAFSL
jgi:hypothetical protein